MTACVGRDPCNVSCIFGVPVKYFWIYDLFNDPICLEVNAEKTKCILISHEQNVEQNYDTKIHDKYFEVVEEFKRLGWTRTNQICVQ